MPEKEEVFEFITESIESGYNKKMVISFIRTEYSFTEKQYKKLEELINRTSYDETDENYQRLKRKVERILK